LLLVSEFENDAEDVLRPLQSTVVATLGSPLHTSLVFSMEQNRACHECMYASKDDGMRDFLISSS
jgi:hypothetical protein